MTTVKPLRLSLAQALCRPLPPLVSQRLRSVLYPLGAAVRHNYPFDARSQTGSRLQGHTGDFHGYPFAVHGYYEWRNLAVALAVCKPGDTVIEIGANIGTETVGFADIVGPTGRVHAFEPLPANLDALRKTIALNGSQTIIPHPTAVGAECGRLRFAVPPPSSSGTGHLLGDGEVRDDVIEVECVTLDSIAGGLGRARAVFIDAEGAEVGILRGATGYLTETRPALVLEASPKHLERSGSSLAELDATVRALGYEPRRITRLGVDEPDPAGEAHASNWLCTPAGSDDPRLVRRMLFWCGVLPFVFGLNPIARIGRR